MAARKIKGPLHARLERSFPGDRTLDFKPLVSYITVAYNAEKTIEKTFASIIECKSIIDCEYIVIDGNSTDGTALLIDRYSEIIDVKVIEEDSGIYDAMNKGIRQANGEYACFVNADDYLIPEGVARIERILRSKNRRADVVASAALAKDASTEWLWQPSPPDQYVVFRCPNLCHNAVYAKMSVFNTIGSFDTSLRIAADSDWIIRAYRFGFIFRLVDTPTVVYSLGGESSDLKLHSEEMQIIALKAYPLLEAKVLLTLFYYLIAWQERKQMYTESPGLSLREAIGIASSHYPELSFIPQRLDKRIKHFASRVHGRLTNAIRAWST